MSIYLPSSIGTTTNLVSFNDFNATPVYRLISKQPQRRQIRELDLPVPFESGISDFETLIGQTAFVLEGIMYPGNENEYDLGIRALRKISSLDISQDDILSDDGYVPYQWDEFTGSRILYVKVLYVQIVENTRQGLVQPFRLICKVKDPTIFGSELKQANTSQATPSASTGSALYSFTYPVLYGKSTYSVSSAIQNNGDISAYPIGISVYGPVSNPRVTNVTTGEYIEVTTTLSTVSNVLSISYDKDSLYVTVDGVNNLRNVTSASTYFKLPPGTSVISLTGSTISTGAYATLSYRDSYPLS